MHIKSIFLLTVVILLSGCKSLGNLAEGDKINYKHGLSSTSVLELPPQVNKQDVDAPYIAPDAQTFSQFVQQRAANNNQQVLSTVPQAKIERDGQRRWLVINQTPQEVWPKLEQFWNDLGFKLETNSPQTGVMETNWVENKKNAPNDMIRQLFSKIIDFAFSSDKKDRFKTRIEVNNGATEIYVTHQGIEEQFDDKTKDTTKWYGRNSEPEVEAEILRRMMLTLGLNKQQANYLSEEYKKVNPATPIKPENLTQISLPTTQDNAWRSVGIALDRAGFMIESKDLQELNYKVRYLDPSQFNQQPGFWARLTQGKKIEELRKSKIHTIKIISQSQTSKIIVLDSNGNQDNSIIAQNILRTIQEHL